MILILAHPLLGRVMILRQTRAIVDDDVRLQAADDFHQALSIVILRRLPQPVKPKNVESAVVGAQLGHLLLQIGQIPLVPVGRKGVGVMPVGLRIIKTKAKSRLVAGLGQLLDDVAAERAQRLVIL